MNNKYTVVNIPAIGSNNGWIRTAKTVYISKKAPAWLVAWLLEKPHD